MAWLVYALGGGFGHLTRAVALARAASPDTRVRILTNSPYAGIVRNILPELDLVAIDPAATIAKGRLEVLLQLEAPAPDCLIVDTFPRGLVGELADPLADFPGLKVLVQRDLNPRYSTRFELNSFVAATYDLVLDAGDTTTDGLGPFPQSSATPPWLVRSRHELFSRERAREILGLRDQKPCIIVCAAGNAEELDWFGAVTALIHESSLDCDVRCIAPKCPDACPTGCWRSYWPALDLYAAADVMVGGAGYNTVYESLACGVPLVARPWSRKYDRQVLRANRAAHQGLVVPVNEPRDAVRAVGEILTEGPRIPRYSRFRNGAGEAVRLIREKAVVATSPRM